MSQFFTEEEARELNAILINGGVFVQIYDDPNQDVIVYKPDNNGGFTPLATLDETLAKKLYNLRDGKVPAGFHMLGLSYIINKYIRHKYF